MPGDTPERTVPEAIRLLGQLHDDFYLKWREAYLKTLPPIRIERAPASDRPATPALPDDLD